MTNFGYVPVEARGSVLALSDLYRGRLLNPGVVTRGRAMSGGFILEWQSKPYLGPFEPPQGAPDEANVSKTMIQINTTATSDQLQIQ